ncbi:MAG: hypothetical protein LBT10_08390, partial [Methanobrevibacter sp.]|nr:hypothetical protein [Methanobrevibacter sp.]
MIKKSNKILSLMILIGLMSYCITTQAADDTITINPGNGTIQEAIDNANIGGTILLENGTYNGTGNYNITVNKTVTIKAAPNNDTPIINAEGKGRIFSITANNVILNGLNLTGGLSNGGGGIYNNGNNSGVSNSNFINNTATTGAGIGGGIQNSGANFRVSNTSFINNTATNGG